MVTLLLDSAQLEVVLSPFERAMSRRATSLRIPRTQITKAQLTDDAWTWLRGVPSPGTHVSGVLAMGTWRSAGGDDFVVLRRRQPAVILDLDDSAGAGDAQGDVPFTRVMLSTRHGLALVQALRLESDGEAVDVSEIVPSAPDTSPAPPSKPRRARVPKPAPAT